MGAVEYEEQGNVEVEGSNWSKIDTTVKARKTYHEDDEEMKRQRHYWNGQLYKEVVRTMERYTSSSVQRLDTTQIYESCRKFEHNIWEETKDKV